MQSLSELREHARLAEMASLFSRGNWRNTTTQERRMALATLKVIPHVQMAQYADAVMEMLDDEHEGVRWSAAEAGQPHTVQMLLMT